MAVSPNLHIIKTPMYRPSHNSPLSTASLITVRMAGPVVAGMNPIVLKMHPTTTPRMLNCTCAGGVRLNITVHVFTRKKIVKRRPNIKKRGTQIIIQIRIFINKVRERWDSTLLHIFA